MGERELERKEVIVAGKVFDLGLKGLMTLSEKGRGTARRWSLRSPGGFSRLECCARIEPSAFMRQG